MEKLKLIRTIHDNSPVRDLIDALDFNVKSPILLAIREIEEKTGAELNDETATIRAALNLWECIEYEAHQLFRQNEK